MYDLPEFGLGALLGGEFGALLPHDGNQPIHTVGLDHRPVLMAQGNRHAHTLDHDVEKLVLARIPQMDYQFDDLLGRFCYKNQCNTIIATGQTRLTWQVKPESLI